jgi:N,N'-diacetyllegionaminate synthase
MKKVFIIAEAGVNHNGQFEIAKELIDAAVKADVDAIKFQLFKTENLVTKKAEKAEYQKISTLKSENQYDMLKHFELSYNNFFKLYNYCKSKKKFFLCSPFDLESIDFLNKLKIGIFKIPSGEITNLPYLEKIGKLGKKVILSTGMADLGEIENALNILVKSGTKKENITILHCTTEYPTPYEDVNLRAMLTIKEAFKVNVGYSDHTLGIEVPLAAVALGATVIEKHFTLDKSMKGPDHKASLEPHELRSMVLAIRNVEKSLGDGIKRLSKSEINNKKIVRKSIVAKREIKKGEIFSLKNITVKRPGIGLSPMRWYDILGKVAKKDYKEDELIEN